MGDRVKDELELRALAANYAIGADTKDGARFTSAFHPDAVLLVWRDPKSPEPHRRMSGHAELEKVPTILAEKYDKTFHFLGQSVYEIGENEAKGLTYCLAHHLSLTMHGGTNYVMHMQYADVYRRDKSGAWKIAERRATVNWTETRASLGLGTV